MEDSGVLAAAGIQVHQQVSRAKTARVSAIRVSGIRVRPRYAIIGQGIARVWIADSSLPAVVLGIS